MGVLVPQSAWVLCAGASLVLWHCPTPWVHASWSCLWGSPCGPCGDRPGQTQGLPRPAPTVAGHARGLRPRQVRGRLARAARPLVPSACAARVGTQDAPAFGALSPACPCPCPRFTVLVPEARAGLGASVGGDPFAVGDLHSFTLCRFVSAHPNARPELLPAAGAQRTLKAVGFQVKAPVPRRPLHRAGREGFPHPVPR